MLCKHEIIESNPALDMAGALIPPHTTHRAALTPERIPELLSRIDNYKGRKLTRLALELNLLTFVRSSELRFARWGEIDVERAVWEIPAKREPLAGVIYSERGMKMKSPHIVPLSRQALDVLRQLEALRSEEEHIFPGDHDPYRVINGRTIKTLQAMGYDTKTEVCGHGFRTMARGAIDESGLWADDVIELQMRSVCPGPNVVLL